MPPATAVITELPTASATCIDDWCRPCSKGVESVITATAELAGCGPAGGPYLAVACLLGADGVTHCTQGRGADPAVISVPYQPGVTYIATGRGCPIWLGQNVAPDCQILGPLTATL